MEEEEIEWFCRVWRRDIYLDEKFKKFLKGLNKWYLEKTQEAYDKFCLKEEELCKKEKIKYEELRRILEEYLDEIDDINSEYIIDESENYCDCFMRNREVIKDDI